MPQINQKEEKKEKPRPSKPKKRPVKKPPVRKPSVPKKKPSRPTTQPKKVVKPVVTEPHKSRPQVSPSKVGKTTRPSGPRRHTGSKSRNYESRKAQRHTNYSLYKDDTAGKRLHEEKRIQKQDRMRALFEKAKEGVGAMQTKEGVAEATRHTF